MMSTSKERGRENLLSSLSCSLVQNIKRLRKRMGIRINEEASRINLFVQENGISIKDTNLINL